MRLARRVVPVTGAGSGICLARARLFAAEGASVVLADIKDASAEAAALGSRCMVVAMDVTDAREVTPRFHAAKRTTPVTLR